MDTQQNIRSGPGRRFQRFRNSLVARFFVRFHMTLILAAAVAGGVLANRLLLQQGVTAMLWRYPAGVVAAYLMFLAMVRLWIWYVRSGSDAVGDVIEGLSELEPGTPGSGSAVVAGGEASGTRWSLEMPDLDVGEEGGLVLIVLAVLVAVILGAGGYLIWMAPEILAEAAFEAALASSLVRATNRLEREGWVVGVVRVTAVPFAVVLAMTVGLAYAVQQSCPGAVTLREGLRCEGR